MGARAARHDIVEHMGWIQAARMRVRAGIVKGPLRTCVGVPTKFARKVVVKAAGSTHCPTVIPSPASHLWSGGALPPVATAAGGMTAMPCGFASPAQRPRRGGR
jgi:hypothetical protein